MKAFKHAVFIVLIIIISENFSLSQVYWIRKQSPVTSWLNKCTFTDTLNGWACGESGVIIHSSNGGENWIQQYSHPDYYLEGISFVNNRVGWCIGNDYAHSRSIVFNTTNGGLNWNVNPYPDSSLILNTVYFIDSLNGYMGGFEGTILKTTDAGKMWNLMKVDSSSYYKYPIKNFSFFNSRIGVACGGIMEWGGVIWKTTNYGYNWTSLLAAPEPIFDIAYADSGNAYGSVGDYDIGPGFVNTENNWDECNYEWLGFWGIGQAIAMRTRSEIWIPLSFSQSWAVSIDTGKHWQWIINNDSDAVNDALFIDSTHGWAVGSNGRVYKFNKEIIGIENYGKAFPSAFKLFQNYPNPFNPVTKIKFSLPFPSEGGVMDVHLIIYDVLGREVASLITPLLEGKEGLKAGTYEVDWNASGHPSGVYFYKLTSGSYSETKKMVLLK